MKWQKLSSILQVQDGILDPIPYGHTLAASMHPAYISDATFFAPLERKILAFCWSISSQRAKDTPGRLQNN